MRYLSVCSGIEAASVAWHHLGWEPVGFSEIEPFPAAVLAHRFPNIPNYGDMTKHEQWPITRGAIDLLVGGTPCQSFSVAGLRQGLADPRGNLMLTYLAIADRLRPRWLVWENVPGVLSSNGGRDFGTFLGSLGELGYGWAYRVLDAQYIRVGRWPRAVPQRRRRVFVVGRLIERGARDWAAPGEVLALAEGLQGYLRSRRAKGKGVAADAEVGSGSGCCGTVSSKWGKGTGGPAGDECYNLIAQPTAYRWQNDRDGLQEDDAVAALRASQGASGFHEMNHPVITQPVPYDLFQITAPVNRHNRAPGDPCHMLAKDNAAHAAVVNMQGSKSNACVSTDGTSFTLNAMHGHDVHAVAFQQNQLGEVRCNTVAGTVNTNSNPSWRNTPMVAIGTDCYNGAITGDVAATMGTPGSSVNASGPTVMQAVAFPIDTQNMTEGHSSGGLGFGKSDDPSLTVTKGHSHAVAHAHFQDSQFGCKEYDSAAIRAGRIPEHSMIVNPAMTVRRLTPRECERLQGFPDDWTMIPYRGKQPEDCPDGPRYKALGNSMACNCMSWIGERIAAYEAQNGST